MSALAHLETIVLGPLTGRPEADWQRAPAGKWTPAQIVEHLAISMNSSADTFERRRGYAPMQRRARGVVGFVAQAAILGLRWFPRGFTAPERTQPAPAIPRVAAEAHFRDGLTRWAALERDLLPARPRDVFVKHPRLGDLTLAEWIRFHEVHARHHARQIRERLAP
jgi:hypothetical protein